MLKTTLTAVAAAGGGISDGATCHVELRVSDLHRQIVLGAPGFQPPFDVLFEVLSVDDPNNHLCQRALRADQARMNAASEQIEGVNFAVGDELKAKVVYQKFMAGKMLYDEYHHTAIITEGVGAGSFYNGFGLLP